MTPFSGSDKKLAAIRRKEGQGTCIMPPAVPNNTVSFALVANNERCLEAEVTPLRRLLQEQHDRRGLVIGPNPTFPTEQQCFECE